MKEIYYFSLALFLSLFITLEVQAQVTFDENAIADNSAGVDNSVDFTVTAGTNRLLVAVIGTDDMTGVPTVAFNGTNLVLAAEDLDNHDNTYDSRVLVFYLALGDGAAISDNITVSNLSDSYLVGGMTFQEIDQSNPLQNSVQGGIPSPTNSSPSSRISATINNVTEGNLLFAFFGEDNVKQFNWGGNYIAEGTHTSTNLNGDGYYFATYNANAASGSHTFGYDVNNGGQTCAGVIIEFAQASAPPVEVICDGDIIAITPTYFSNFLMDQQNNNGGSMPESITAGASDKINTTATIDPFINGTNPRVVFQAANSVTMEAGFHAVAGSDFTAKIGNCDLPVSGIDSDIYATNRMANIHPEAPIVETEFAIYPNPAKYATAIKVELAQESAFSLQLMNQNGQIIKQLVTTNYQEEGTYYYQLNTADFTPGFYLVQMDNGTERVTKKLIIQ